MSKRQLRLLPLLAILAMSSAAASVINFDEGTGGTGNNNNQTVGWEFNVLSGVYSFGSTTKGQLALCLHAAEQSARNLRHGGSSSSSAPTA